MSSLYQADILTIGSELMKGSVLNTNSAFLARELAKDGFQVTGMTSCHDDPKAIEEQLAQALARSEAVIVTGGLGPTPDDITRDCLAHFFKVPLIFSKIQFRRIEKYYLKLHKKIPAIVRKEAMYPENAIPLVNRFGIALGFYIVCGGRVIIVLPGVPLELENMYRELVRPLWPKFFPNLGIRPSLIIKTLGLSEADVMRLLGKDFFDEPFDFGIYPNPGEVALRLYASRESILKKLKLKIQKRMNRHVYAFEEASLPEVILKIMSSQGMSLSVMESCTGGLLGAELTAVPGSSAYFKGGIVAYDNDIKSSFGVPPSLIRKKGAVSLEVAQFMAKQACLRFNTHYGIGVTGIAGPSGGSRNKPVGLVYIALAFGSKLEGRAYRFWGNRDQIRLKSAKKAMELLWRNLQKRPTRKAR